ncbi:YHS domain-containing (seleno)protein [Mucilaginibacter ginsenosidivorans]|uniref:YHS domain-containing protein n=1 Tax=Mucilaginibacter ginsenosidivorans TaxID=398053 RepID=A0A5B8UZN8_9SPHI|nr:YHS domain-containing (seleno)protein [Mucilaginibacter ginsenosidivorans]QEC64053.1 YHS domain-containing protein [Mucilaginibacter ginsenosidivorans]
MFKKHFFTILILCLAAAAFAQKTPGTLLNLNGKGVIIDGYDPVAFFTDNKPVMGDPKFQTSYQGAIYYFASQEHLDAFTTSPEKYKPQFGGYCAYAVSLGRTAPIDVRTFSIVNDRLVLQHNQRAVNGWNKDVQGNLRLADQYWPAVVANNGKQIKTDAEKGFLNNVDKDGVILEGYDVVSYFTGEKPLMGNKEFDARYQGATYWFSTPENASKFKDNPEKYAPQYGGFCGYAVSLGKLRPVNPLIYQLYNGKLILQHTQDAYDHFNKDLDSNVKKADENWPVLIKKKAGKFKGYDAPAMSPDNKMIS